MNSPLQLPNSSDSSMAGVWPIILCYLGVAMAFFALFAWPSLLGELSVAMHADSVTYMNAYERGGNSEQLVGVEGNYLGPLLILGLAKGNLFLVHLINAALVTACVIFFVKNLKARFSVVLPLILLNPLIWFSLFGVNKETIALAALAALMISLRNRSTLWAILAVALAFLARWHMAIFTVAALGSAIVLRANTPYRRLILAGGLLVGLSVVFPRASALIEPILNNALSGDDPHEKASGIWCKYTEIQAQQFGHLLVFWPKSMHIIVGMAARIQYIVDLNDFWNNAVITTYSCFFSLVLCLCVVRKKFTLNNDFIFLAFLYFAIFSLSPIYSPRYFLPAYILLVLALTCPADSIWPQANRGGRWFRIVTDPSLQPCHQVINLRTP